MWSARVVGVWVVVECRWVAGAGWWRGAFDGELVDDLLGEGGVVDECEDAQAAVTFCAFEDVDVEGARHERGPVDAGGRREQGAAADSLPVADG